MSYYQRLFGNDNLIASFPTGVYQQLLDFQQRSHRTVCLPLYRIRYRAGRTKAEENSDKRGLTLFHSSRAQRRPELMDLRFSIDLYKYTLGRPAALLHTFLQFFSGRGKFAERRDGPCISKYCALKEIYSYQRTYSRRAVRSGWKIYERTGSNATPRANENNEESLPCLLNSRFVRVINRKNKGPPTHFRCLPGNAAREQASSLFQSPRGDPACSSLLFIEVLVC